MKSAISILCLIEGALCLLEPSYISNWTYIEAHNETHCEVTFNHSLGERPVKVDVQVLAIDGPNEGFIFSGIGSAQTGSVANQTVGGVVYIYNEEQVVVMAPNTPDRTASVINTGKDTLLPNGSLDHQISFAAQVRVRVWKASDFPSPRKKRSFQMSVNNGAMTYHKMENASVVIVRAFVTVQVLIEAGDLTGWTCDAQGSSVVGDRTAPWGGLIYKRNPIEQYIEFWAPSAALQDGSEGNGSLCNTVGGWGRTEGRSGPEGTVTVKIWPRLANPFLNSTHFQRTFLSKNTRDKDLDSTVDLDHHILHPWAYVREVISGNSSTTLHTSAWIPFGSSLVVPGNQEVGAVVFAYNATRVRIWFSEKYQFYRGVDTWGEGEGEGNSSLEMANVVVVHNSLSAGCLEMPAIKNGMKLSPPPNQQEPFSVGSETNYTCNRGYKPTGNITGKCGHLGNWHHRKCRVVKCPDPDKGLNSTFSPASGSYEYNMTVTYSCLTGYNATSVDVERTCDEDERWTGSPLDCTVVTCPDPEPGQNSAFSPASEEYQYNTTVTYSCLAGYQSTGGHVTRTCNESGSWTGSPLNCTETVCQCGCDVLDKYTVREDIRNEQGSKPLATKVKEIQEKLHVPKRTTSHFRRKLVSIPDDRPVAKGVGYVAVTFFCLLIGCIALSDVVNLVTFFTRTVTSKKVEISPKTRERHSTDNKI